MRFFRFDRSDDVKIIKNTKDASAEYVEDGEIRLIFREGKYAGWYMPGEQSVLFPDGWTDPEIELPADPDECVIAVISGKRGNQTFVCCPIYATYDHNNEEWIPDDYPDLVPEKVWCWTFAPELPQVCKDEINKYHEGESHESKTER